MKSHRFVLFSMLAAGCLMGGEVRADFLGIDILVQRDLSGAKLVTGFYDDDDGSRSAPHRVFGTVLQPTTYDIDEPGIRAVDASGLGVPAGTMALPGSTPLFIDLLPMTINSISSNLFYWKGVGALDFAPVSLTTFEVSGTGGFAAIADGTDTTASSSNPFVTTSATGTIHRHPVYVLDNDSKVDEGIYLVSLGFRMDGFDPADPAFLVLATSTFNGSLAHLTAGAWVEQNLAAVPEPSTLLLAAFQAFALAGWHIRKRTLLPWRQASSLPIS